MSVDSTVIGEQPGIVDKLLEAASQKHQPSTDNGRHVQLSPNEDAGNELVSLPKSKMLCRTSKTITAEKDETFFRMPILTFG